MAYTARMLQPNEYERLLELGIPREKLPSPDTAIVAVIEEDGKIVGRWIAGTVTILEGLQIEEAYRNSPGVARKLLQIMMAELRSLGVASAITFVQNDMVGELARHAGFDRLPGTIYQKDLRPTERGT